MFLAYFLFFCKIVLNIILLRKKFIITSFSLSVCLDGKCALFPHSPFHYIIVWRNCNCTIVSLTWNSVFRSAVLSKELVLPTCLVGPPSLSVRSSLHTTFDLFLLVLFFIPPTLQALVSLIPFWLFLYYALFGYPENKLAPTISVLGKWTKIKLGSKLWETYWIQLLVFFSFP